MTRKKIEIGDIQMPSFISFSSLYFQGDCIDSERRVQRQMKTRFSIWAWITVTNATMNAKKQKIILRDNQSEVFLWAFC